MRPPLERRAQAIQAKTIQQTVLVVGLAKETHHSPGLSDAPRDLLHERPFCFWPPQETLPHLKRTVGQETAEANHVDPRPAAPGQARCFRIKKDRIPRSDAGQGRILSQKFNGSCIRLMCFVKLPAPVDLR